MIWDFFRHLGQQRIDSVVNTAKAKEMGAVAKAKAGAARQFNKVVDAPVEAAKAAGKQAQSAKKADSAKKEGGEMGWFSKKREPERDSGGGFAEPERTVALDVSQLNRGSWKPCVGWIVMMSGELKGRDFRLVDGKNVIGTAADCDIVLTDAYLSSKHAVIRHENGEFTLVDLDSTNGTYVNDRRVSKEDLIDNDKIRLGRSEMKFKALE